MEIIYRESGLRQDSVKAKEARICDEKGNLLLEVRETQKFKEGEARYAITLCIADPSLIERITMERTYKE